MTADYYEKKTSNLLLQISLPFETGFQSALANRGAVENSGFEFGVDARILEPAKNSGGPSWRANVNYSQQPQQGRWTSAASSASSPTC